MLREERLWRITQLLTEERKVRCDELADEFGLTLASIRLDLAELERRGVAKRVYGGAILVEPDRVNYALEIKESRLAERFELQRMEKEAIGFATAGLIHDGETIMVDGGTTTIHVCRNLVNKRNLTIISSTLNTLWPELAAKPGLQIFLTGGYLRAESLSFVGEIAETVAGGFRASKAILGIDGISLENGFTALNFLEAGVKKRMIQASQELIIVADHTKFGKVAPIPVAPIEAANTVVTDTGVSSEFVSRLERHGLKVIAVEPGKVNNSR